MKHRLAAIRRLYLSKLEKMPSDMPHEQRCESARTELDKVLGTSWRDEVEEAGEELDPTGDMLSLMDRLPEATREAGFKGDDIPEPKRTKSKEEVMGILTEYFK